jgi:2,5-diamino-6-(ribosylamino)-4(3H)-pyrimidinone 5'-phosphate reductase
MSDVVERPRIICHMIISLDGRIVVDGWPLAEEGRRQYELVHASYEPDGWICGRVTMEPFARRVRPEAEIDAQEPGRSQREDFVAEGEFESYAFALDASGRLAWESNDISGDHVVAILSDRVSDDHLHFLRGRGVSYLLAGEREIDLPLAMRKIHARFGVKTLMLEGGGRINGGMLRAGLIDEISLLVAPVADGRMGLATLFDAADAADAGGTPRRLELVNVERRADDILWLRYRFTS